MYYDFHGDPFVAYQDSPPHAQTAVVSVMELGNTVPTNEIYAVDGLKLSCLTAGCPMWVRVTPGKHTFALRRTENRRLSSVGGYADVANLQVPIESLEPRHVYVISLLSSEGKVFPQVKDLGESPDYGIMLGKGQDRTYRRVTF
jgi:hypothetical protein